MSTSAQEHEPEAGKVFDQELRVNVTVLTGLLGG